MVARHRTQQLQCFLYMLHHLCTGCIISFFPFLHKVICHNAEIALEHLHLLMRQISDFKQIDLIVVDKRPEFFRDIHTFQKRYRLIPVLFMSKVQYQRHNGIAHTCFFFQKLCSILRAIIADHTKRHIRVNACLIFYADAGQSYLLFFPAFGYIPLDLMNFSICLIV